MDPLSMNFQQMGQMGMALQGQAFGGVSDTGAAPDSSAGSAMLINMMAPGSN